MLKSSPVAVISEFIESLGEQTAKQLKFMAVAHYIGARSFPEEAAGDGLEAHVASQFQELFVAAARNDRSLGVYLYLSHLIEYELWSVLDPGNQRDREAMLEHMHGDSALADMLKSIKAGQDRYLNDLSAKTAEWRRLREGPLSFHAVHQFDRSLWFERTKPT